MLIILRVLLTLIHLSYDLIQWSGRRWKEGKSWCDELWNGKDTSVDADVLARSLKGVGNLPRHLTVILGHEEVSFLDLVRIVGWCVIAGIPYVTFYDHNGFLQRSKDVIEKKLVTLRPDLEQQITWTSRSSVKTTKYGINGTKHKTKIQLLSYEDGKRRIVSLAQDLANAVTSGVLEAKEIDVTLLSDKLQLEDIPDPDLAFVCGHTFSTYGFLPWHIRITEFILIPSHHNIQVKDFVNLLKRFSKCEQRFGK